MKYRILIVEDNDMNLELATDLLELNGFIVLQARSAEAGLRLAHQTAIDLILMDLSLPGMDGLAATRELKQDPTTRQVPVLALTAHAMRGDADIIAQAGCDGYLIKPINTREFAAQVRAFLEFLQVRPGAATPA